MIKKIAKKITKKAASKASSAKTASKKKTSRKKLSQEELNAMIAAKAYEIYESRGYTHGDDQYDWYQAEQIVLGRK